MQAYSDPAREDDPNALPDIEIFHSDDYTEFEGNPLPNGFYWWTCFPDCLPDSEPNGPFDTEEEALRDAQNGND